MKGQGYLPAQGTLQFSHALIGTQFELWYVRPDRLVVCGKPAAQPLTMAITSHLRQR